MPHCPPIGAIHLSIIVLGWIPPPLCTSITNPPKEPALPDTNCLALREDGFQASCSVALRFKPLIGVCGEGLAFYFAKSGVLFFDTN